MSNVIIDLTTGCWVWGRAKDSNGYGMLTIHGKQVRLHRLAALIWHAIPLPAKKVIRHICDNPSCFNPEHIIPGTQAENMKDCSTKGRIANSKKTICKRGHALSGENLYVCTNASGNPMRVCRSCRTFRMRNYMRKKRHSSLPHNFPVQS